MSTQPIESRSSNPEEKSISVRPATLQDIEVVAEIAVREIGPHVASRETIRRVMCFNSEGLFVVLSANPVSHAPEIVGFSAHLLLNESGLQALISGRFDYRDPSLNMLCSQGESPAALFGWGVVAKGIYSLMAPLVKDQLCGPRFQGLDFYSRGTTPAGVRALIKTGAVPVTSGDDPMAGCLMVIRQGSQHRWVA